MDIDFTAYYRLHNSAFKYADRMQVYETSHTKELPFFRLPEKTDLKVMASTTQSSTNASTTYDIMLINNEYTQKTRTLYWR